MTDPTTLDRDEQVDARTLGQMAVVAKLVMDELGDMGKAAKGALLPEMTRTGSSQQTVTAADKVKMATISLAGGVAKAAVTDEKAFLAWVVERHPGEVLQIVRESFTRAVLARADDIGEAVDTEGEVIPGVEFVDRDPYLSVRPTKAARERIRAVLEESDWIRQLPAGFTTSGGAA